MWTQLAKLLIKLVPPEKWVEIFIIAFFCVILVVGLFFAGPIVIFKHIPLGKSTQEFNYYMEASKKIEQETGVYVHWQHIMAIDAVLLDQEFETSSLERAYGYKSYFIKEEQKTIQKTCIRIVTTKNEEGEEIEVEEEYDCSETITVYSLRSYDEVLNKLVADGKLDPAQIEDVKNYTIYDASPLTEQNSPLPPGWTPVIRGFTWPLENIYKVSSMFGPRTDPVEFETRVHNGIDIAAPTGTPVYAIKEGKVIYAKYMGNAGNAVIIQHSGDTESRYYHLSKISVRAGQEVEMNEKIGEVGSTGKSTGPHLHLEIRIAAVPIDPLSYYR